MNEYLHSERGNDRPQAGSPSMYVLKSMDGGVTPPPPAKKFYEFGETMDDLLSSAESL